jgi:hypothetical protein
MAQTSSPSTRTVRRLRNGGAYLLPDGTRVRATHIGSSWLLLGRGGAEYRLTEVGAIARAHWARPRGGGAPVLRLSPTDWWRTDLRPATED